MCSISRTDQLTAHFTQPLKASVVISPLGCELCVWAHTCAVFGGVGGGGRGRSIFMSRFVRFYFIFLISFPQSTYAFWCLRPHDFAFISD